jgi:hypothetical protein
MSGSSSSAPPCDTKVSSSRPPQATGRDKTVGSSSRQVAPLPERTSGQFALTWRLAERAPPRYRGPHPAKPTPRGGRRSGRRPPASFMIALIASNPTPCRGAGRGGGHRTQRRHRARRRWRCQELARGACSRCLSGVAEPRTFMCPSSPAGATVQPRSLRRPWGQPPSEWERVLSLLRRRVEAEQPPSRRARSAQPPNRARQTAR